MGSGFVAESYDKEPQKTLLSYLAHVSFQDVQIIPISVKMHSYTCIMKSLIKELNCEFKILNNNYIAAHLVQHVIHFLTYNNCISGFCSSTSYYYILFYYFFKQNTD